MSTFDSLEVGTHTAAHHKQTQTNFVDKGNLKKPGVHQRAEITINFVDVVKQAGSYDRGLYAIAYVTALAHGNDPATHHYCQEKMRPYLRKCLLDRKLRLFPHKTICPSGNFHSVEKLAVYCLCRMPEIEGQPMVECSKCKEWYHFVCAKVTPKSLTKNAKWYCTHCTTH